MSGPIPLRLPLTCKQSYQLDDTFWVSFQMQGGQVNATWSPTVPKPKQMRKLMPLYREARHSFLGKLGVGFVVIEL